MNSKTELKTVNKKTENKIKKGKGGTYQTTWPQQPITAAQATAQAPAQDAAHTTQLPLRKDKTEDNVFVFVSNSGRPGARHRDAQGHVPRRRRIC
jgi:hypothetical protein